MKQLPLFTSSFRLFAQYLGKTLIFLCVVGLLIHLCFERYIIFSGEVNGASKINRILNKHDEQQIPILGSSRALNHFVPSMISPNSFNYGIDGLAPDTWQFFLHEELKKEKSTAIIINFDLDGWFYRSGAVDNYLPNYRETKHLIPDLQRSHYHIPLLKYYGRFEVYFKDWLNERGNFTRITDHGASFKTTQLTDSKFQQLVERRLGAPTEFTDDTKLLDSFLSLVNHTAREIILVVSPYHSSYLESYCNLSEAQRSLSTLDTISNVHVLDFSQMDLGEEYFFDTTHLNYAGAKLFSSTLHQRLKALNLL
ncbi:MAG: hypothetical protein F6K19_20215 [Cyanothece sp. SIO1E1]|nr:hypothetical protein [Cyanothece sp. SIO1E1]